jgi:hypothetical protein
VPHQGFDPTSGVGVGQSLPRQARPKRRVARKVSFLARAAGQSSFQARPFLGTGMMAVTPRLMIAA